MRTVAVTDLPNLNFHQQRYQLKSRQRNHPCACSIIFQVTVTKHADQCIQVYLIPISSNCHQIGISIYTDIARVTVTKLLLPSFPNIAAPVLPAGSLLQRGHMISSPGDKRCMGSAWGHLQSVLWKIPEQMFHLP